MLRFKQNAVNAKWLTYGFGFIGTLAVSLAFIAASGLPAMAQSTIFNIPSTDTVEKKKVYFEYDQYVQAPKDSGSDRLSIFLPRGVVGVTKTIEAGANIGVTHVGGLNQVYFQPNMKWKFFSDEKSATAGTVGAILFTPVNNRSGNDTYGLLYANFSKKVGKLGPRLTVGPYGVVGGKNAFAGVIKAGAIVGFEHGVYKRLSFVSDWFSGKNGFGYWTPGISISLPKNGLFNAGYSIGNDSYNGNSTHNRLVFLYYGITL